MADINLETPEVRSVGRTPAEPVVPEGAAVGAEAFLAPIGESLGRLLNSNLTQKAADKRAAEAALAEDQEASSMINVLESMSDVYGSVRERAVDGEFINPGAMTIEVNEAWSRALVAESKRNPGFLTSDAIVKAWNIHSGIVDDISKQSSVEIDGLMYMQDSHGNMELLTNMDPEDQLEESFASVVNWNQEFNPIMATEYLRLRQIATESSNLEERAKAVDQMDETYTTMVINHNAWKQLEFGAMQAKAQREIYQLDKDKSSAAARRIADTYADSTRQQMSTVMSSFYDNVLKKGMSGPQAAAAFRLTAEGLFANAAWAQIVEEFPELGKNIQDVVNANASILEASDFKGLKEWEFDIQRIDQKAKMLAVLQRLSPEQQFRLQNAGAWQAAVTTDYIMGELMPALTRKSPDVMARASALAATMGPAGAELADWNVQWSQAPITRDSENWRDFVNDTSNMIFRMHKALALWRANLPNEAEFGPDYVLYVWNTMNQNANFSSNVEEIAAQGLDYSRALDGIVTNLDYFSNHERVGEATRAGAQRLQDIFGRTTRVLQRTRRSQADETNIERFEREAVLGTKE